MVPGRVRNSYILLQAAVLFASVAIFNQNAAAQTGTEAAEAVITIDQPAWYEDTHYFPELGMSLKTGYAPFPVFFQGWESSPRQDIICYSWDFGQGTESDEGGRYAEGLNAGHVFETPGTYAVTLRVQVEDGSWSPEATVDVEVLSGDGGTTFYVDSDIGNDDYDGRSETVDGGSGPWRTATKVFQQMARPTQWADSGEWHYQPGDRILFKRGQSFEMAGDLIIGHGYGTQGYSFGSYGAPADSKPVIQYTGETDDHLLAFGYGSGYIGFTDLEFNFLGEAGQSNGLISAAGGLKNVLFLRCDFYEPGNGVFSLSHGQDDDKITANIFTVASTIQNPETCPDAVTQMYVNGIHGFVLTGNSFDKSGNHIGYFGYLNKGLVSGNIFSRPAFGRTAIRITGGDFDHPGNNIHIKDNYFLGWLDPYTGGSGRGGGAHGSSDDRYNYLLVHLGPNPPRESAYLMLQDILFERNIISNAESHLNICNADNIIVRNNLFVTPDSDPLTITVSNALPDWVSRPSKNIYILNNHFINLINQNVDYTDTGAAFIKIYNYEGADTGFGDRHENIRIQNNLFYSSPGREDKVLSLSDSNNDILTEIESDHNLFHLPDADPASWFEVGDTGYSLAEWVDLTGGQDTRSVSAAPCFAGTLPDRNHEPGDPASLEANIAEADEYRSLLLLNSASPALDAGSPVQVHDDLSGLIRSQGPGHDLGMFEDPE